MAYQYQDAEIIDIIDENDVVKRFFIKVPDDREFSFKAGQFVMLDLPIDSKYTNRSYSIASAPSTDNIFELCIVLNPDGLGTNYMWKNYEVGTTIKLSRVLGKFTLPEQLETDVCFICTGTGVAPFRSQIFDIYNRNLSHKNIYLVFGNRYKKDILYLSEFEKLEQEHPEFNFLPVLSRESEENWSGKKGYVHPIYENIFSDKREAIFYICGWTAMLKEARKRIEEMGYNRKQIKFESYD